MSVSNVDIERLRSDIGRTGFAPADNWLDDAMLASLRQESLAQRGKARRVADDGETSYRGYLADLGPVAHSFLASALMAEFLSSLFGQTFTVTRGSSCYTYFEAGDYLTPHKDGAEDCEVTVLVYLDAESPDPDAPASGLRLQLYDEQGGGPHSVVHTLKTRSGLLVAGRGSRVWHGRPALQPGEHVYLLTACFSSTG